MERVRCERQEGGGEEGEPGGRVLFPRTAQAGLGLKARGSRAGSDAGGGERRPRGAKEGMCRCCPSAAPLLQPHSTKLPQDQGRPYRRSRRAGSRRRAFMLHRHRWTAQLRWTGKEEREEVVQEERQLQSSCIPKAFEIQPPRD